MKVQYTQKYTDADGFTFESGWTAEHTDAEAERRIADGVCQRVSDGAYPRRQQVVVMECAVPDNIVTTVKMSDRETDFFVGAALNDITDNSSKGAETTKTKK